MFGAIGSAWRRGMWLIWSGAILSGTLVGAQDFYRQPQVYESRPLVDREMALDCIGATGIKARFYPGVRLKVEGFTEHAPAKGKLQIGDLVTGVNGVMLKGGNPLVALGNALTEAEATDGKLVFDVQAGDDGAPRTATVTIPVLGRYGKTWPIDCQKSRRIIAAAADFYRDIPEDRGMPSALAVLFLLSTGDDRHLPAVKAYFANFPEDVNKIGDHTWNNGYNGIACAEYYLRTGDKSVLPILQYYADNARDRQAFGLGWPHWGRSISPRYVAGGLMNAAGAQVLTTLLLAKECGIDVDEQTLLGALRFWYRFAGRGTVPYGDHRGEGGLGSNGKDGMAAAAMRIASGAQGHPPIYEQAMKHLSMATLTSYPALVRGHGDEGRGDGIWRGIASSYMLDYKPDDYHEVMNRLTWWHDLSRRPSGAIGMATNQRFDDVGSGAGVALAYTAPMKTLRITGAPPSKFSKEFELPAHLWGNEADRAFLSIENGGPFAAYGSEDPIHVPFFMFGSAYRPAGDLANLPREEILKNVYHKRYMIRAQAAKGLRFVGALDVLEKLLSDEDPRVRRAALDGISDYRYWFHIGRDPLRPGQFTPGMAAAVARMLADEKEAIYVIDGALMVLSLMPPETIGKNLDLILPWTAHEEWWVRQSAFSALASAANDQTLLSQVLPVMNEMMLREDHTQPREGMVRTLARLASRHEAGSPVRRQIITAQIDAARQREVIPGPRAGEGEYDIGQSVDVILKQAPERSAELARVIKSRMPELSTGKLVTIANGLMAGLEKVPDDQREALRERLYSDYRQALTSRMLDEGTNVALMDSILALRALQDEEAAGWQALGRLPPHQRLWRFTAFEPQGQDILHPREKKRFRTVELPQALQHWYRPDFDDSQWEEGRAPIGRGAFVRAGETFTNASAWGEGEFLLMRSTFELDTLDYDYVRISVLAKQGFDIYLNGEKIETYIWWKDQPYYRKIIVQSPAKLLRKGVNQLAVYTGSEYVNDMQIGQIDVSLEGLRKRDLLD